MINSILFFFALALTIFFFGRLLTWMTYKINPTSFKTPFTQKDVDISALAMLIGVILWTLLFHRLSN
jgi:uncharacterized membrane protein